MLTLEQAQGQIFSAIRRADQIETVALCEAVGRFLADEVVARIANPAFDNSAMDGYALCHLDYQAAGGEPLPLSGVASCGDLPRQLKAGSVMRIFTGAPLPSGADTVVIQENAQVSDGRVRFSGAPNCGDNVRYKGEDFHPGKVLYSAGHRVNAYDISLLAANGFETVPVFMRPRVLVVATGNELVTAGAELQPGQIYESNKTSTLAQLRQWGADPVDGGIVTDDEGSLRKVLGHHAEYDFIITSGGASVGDHDLVKRVVEDLGKIDFWRIKIKPGKPVAFGHLGSRCHFFALPGNPVSSLVTFLLMVVPALQVWNYAAPEQILLSARATNDFHRRPGRMEFLRARLSVINGELTVQSLPGQGSHMIGTIARTNGLIRIGEECEGFQEGETVSVMPLSLNL